MAGAKSDAAGVNMDGRSDASGADGMSGVSGVSDASGSSTPSTGMIIHGGNLHEAAERYRIPYAQWLDLSTGINPHGYPVPPVPADAWRRLPDDGDGLADCAARYYGAPDAAHVLPVAGSQAAIRTLPTLLPRATVGIAPLTYGEYAPAFERAGFRVDRFVTPQFADLADAASFVLEPGRALPAALKHLVLVNPNNPGAERFAPDVIVDWHRQLAARGGTLVIDEAFVEAMPALSVARHAHRDGLIVLRSIGKFFGLAGARVGFVLANAHVDDAMRDVRGPWSVAGPARAAARAALLDTAWQTQTRANLAAAGDRLAHWLAPYFRAVEHTPLFAWVRDERAPQWQDALARHGIWTRRFDVVPGLRFGLPADQSQWARLEAALSAVAPTIE